MWPNWLRSPSRFPSSPRSQPPSPRFCCSSFKDIQTLVTEEPGPVSPKTPSLFHRVRISTSVLRTWSHRHAHPSIKQSISQPTHLDQHIILYFTSLRIVRRTFEDCRTVRSILRGFRVQIDERDLSMDGMYLDELQEIIGSKKVTLPVVFIGGKYIGGVKEITELHESGDLKKLIGGLPLSGTSACCDTCGGLRFILCEQCSGSHKIYAAKYGFKNCVACNVNGLIRCPTCVPSQRRRRSSSS